MVTFSHYYHHLIRFDQGPSSTYRQPLVRHGLLLDQFDGHIFVTHCDQWTSDSCD